MAKNYLVFPMEYLTITQSYSGITSHLPHNTGTPKDWPIDIGGRDGGRDWFLCPCDEMKVIKTYGVGNRGVNTVWITSTKKVVFANGKKDYVTMQVTHPNDDDLKKIKKGQVFKRGEKMFREGTDGATANHIHLSVGKGKMSGIGWTQNTKGKWVLTTTNGAIKPQYALFLEQKNSAKVKKNLGIEFAMLLTKPVKYKTTDVLNIRRFAGTGYEKIGTYSKGKTVKVVAKLGKWGLTNKGWISLTYAKKV